jgi:competence protein ComEC
VHRVGGVATLVTDPERVSGAVRVEVRLGARHLDAWARGPDATVLADRLAGERVVVQGTVGGRVPDWLRVRHVVSRLQIDELAPHDRGSPLARLANLLRRTLTRGAASLDPDDRALFTGLVIGDDREQSIETTDDFRGSGLSHLLAVSGQNVAFVLAVAAPLLSRLGLRTRLVGLGAVLLLFATVTRYEPSVLRATAMAGLAGVATMVGRPVRSVRLLALAAAMLLVADPFLVRSVGFGLSVAASAGIVTLSSRIADALPGPASLRGPLSVVLAAQIGVAPLLLVWFDDLPIATLPANLLAEPIAGFVMVWGASAGIVAGLLPPVVGALVHLPTEVALWWIAGVARRCTDARLGSLGPIAFGLAVVGGTIALSARGRRPHLAAIGFGVVMAVLVTPAFATRARAPTPSQVASVGSLRADVSGGLELTVVPTAHPAGALRTLRAAGIDHVARLTLPDDSREMQAVAAAIMRRVRVDHLVYGPDGRDR